MRHSRRSVAVLATIITAIGLVACTGQLQGRSAAHAGPTVLLVCNGSTMACPGIPHYVSVQAAVTAATRGDWILIWPGVYHENDPEYHAGVLITTSDLHIRGLSRSGVIIDGSNGTAADPCPSSPALQNFTPRNGIEVWQANGVSIENLTVCNYLAGPDGEGGNQIWWDGGDGSGSIGINGFAGAYLTATSMYTPVAVNDSHLAQYGIYVGNSSGPGQIVNSYASNMAAAAFYVGACRQECKTVLSRDQGTNSALGYLGTNAGGELTVRDSIFDDNRTGLAPSSLNNDDGPPPQDGRCPGNATKSCTIIEGNSIIDNNNVSVPVDSPGPALGVGVDLAGGQYDTVSGNFIGENKSWGVLVDDDVDRLGQFSFSVCQGGISNFPSKGLCLFPARGNIISDNDFENNGSFGNPTNGDVAVFGLSSTSETPRNCFFGNRVTGGELTSAPVGIERSAVDGQPCSGLGVGASASYYSELACAVAGGLCAAAHSYYPKQGEIKMVSLPSLSGMVNPCSGVPANQFCQGGVFRGSTAASLF